MSRTPYGAIQAAPGEGETQAARVRRCLLQGISERRKRSSAQRCLILEPAHELPVILRPQVLPEMPTVLEGVGTEPDSARVLPVPSTAEVFPNAISLRGDGTEECLELPLITVHERSDASNWRAPGCVSRTTPHRPAVALACRD